MDVRPSRQFRFPPFRLDPDNACLWRETKAVRLTPKAFGVLQCLVERHGQLVTKEGLLERVWPGERKQHSQPPAAVAPSVGPVTVT